MNQADSLMAIALMLRKLVLTSVPGGRRGGYRCPPAGTGQEQPTASLIRLGSRGAVAPASVNNEAQMKARGGKQQVVGQYPEPLADIQGCKKRGESGAQVEVGKRIV